MPSPKLRQVLTGVVIVAVCYFALQANGATLEEAVSATARSLITSLPAGASIAVGSINLQDVDCASPLLEYVRSVVVRLLRESNDCELVEEDKVPLNQVLSELRGVEKELFDPASPEILGRLRQVQYVVTGLARESGSNAEVVLKLVDVHTGNVQKEAVLQIDTRLLPANMPLRAPVSPIIEETIRYRKESARPLAEEGLRVYVFPERLDSRTYRDGEAIALRVVATQDCYLRLFYTDTKGRTFPIFPDRSDQDNHVKGGEAIIVGGNTLPFIAGSPFGVEMVSVFASTEPFDLPTRIAPMAKGFTLPTPVSLKEITDYFRTHVARDKFGKAAIDQACTILTMEKE